MLDATTVLNVLERDSQSIESQLGPQWTEFGHRVGDLADRFKAVAGEDDSQVAASDLELAVNDLLEICWDYSVVEGLLDQAQGTFPEPGPESGGIMRPPSPGRSDIPNARDIVEVKEIANRYYSLLARLKEAANQTKEHPNDRRART